MEKIKIAITGRVASVAALPEVVADNAEYEVDFALDPREGWDISLPITALFVRRDGYYTARIMDAGETSCTMPPQTGTNIVFVGLTQDDMRTTTPATIKVHRSIRTVANDPLPEPSEDVYAQILAAYAGVKILSGKGAPTSETQGKVNQLYRDEDTQRLYICTATDGGYTWAEVSGGTGGSGGSVDVDETLTKAGQAADAKAAGDAIGKKIDKAQGTGNAGKILGIGADGNVTPQDKPAQALYGPAAPTTATAGVVGQEYYVVVNNAVTEMYVCTAAENGTYTWGKVEFGVKIDDTSTEPTKVWSAEKCNQLSEEIADCIKSPTTAEVGQIVKIAAVDDAGKPMAWEAVDLPEQVQADWNQNDGTAADYVKNRTHYEESTHVDYVLNMSFTEIVGLSMPEVGETMTVKINGVESAETVKENSTAGMSYKYIGNIDIDSLLNGGTGWCVLVVQGKALGLANPDTTIAVENIVVHKINDKFINFDGFVRTFDYHFKIGAIYKTLYKDNGDECILYMCDNFIRPENDSQLFGFMSELGFSNVGSTNQNSCFVIGYIININGDVTVKCVVLGTVTSEMEQTAADYGYTLTTNPKA